MPLKLTELNDDVLAYICLAVHEVQITESSSAGLLKQFSTTSKRIRSATLPALYRTVSVAKKSVRESTELMHALQGAGITRYIR